MANETEYVCVVDDALFTKEQGSFSEYAITSKGFDFKKSDTAFLNVDGKSFTKTFVHSSDDKTVIYYGAKDPQILNYAGIHKVYGHDSKVYMDKYKLLMYVVRDTSGKHKMGFTVEKKSHLLILSVPIKAILKYECMVSRKDKVSKLDTKFKRNDTLNIVEDINNNLQWQDEQSAHSKRMTWDDAQSYCSSLKIGNFKNWRLPNKVELTSIVDKEVKYPNPKINHEFKHSENNDYWTSSTYEDTQSKKISNNTKHLVNFSNGYYGALTKSGKTFVRCVRNK